MCPLVTPLRLYIVPDAKLKRMDLFSPISIPSLAVAETKLEPYSDTLSKGGIGTGGIYTNLSASRMMRE